MTFQIGRGDSEILLARQLERERAAATGPDERVPGRVIEVRGSRWMLPAPTALVEAEETRRYWDAFLARGESVAKGGGR